jgi:hypothetical protein
MPETVTVTRSVAMHIEGRITLRNGGFMESDSVEAGESDERFYETLATRGLSL